MRSASAVLAVSMMIGVRRVWFSRRRRRHNSIPFMPGSIKSSTITVGGFCASRASVRPCSPVEATIAEKPSDSRLYLTLSAMSASSSMIRAGLDIARVFIERLLTQFTNNGSDEYDQQKRQRSEKGCRRDGENPGPHNSTRHPPLDG